MIGNSYWSTGICVAFDGKQWAAWCSFYDAGFCDEGSTEGKIHLRYRVTEIGQGLLTLKADAEKLGIEFIRQGVAGKTALYAYDVLAGERSPLPLNWREVLEPIAQALGFDLVENYKGKSDERQGTGN